MSGSTPRRKAKRRLRRPGVADTVQGPSSGPTAPREEATPNVDLHAQAAQENLDRDFRAAVTGGLAAAVAMVARNAEDFGIVPDKERFKTILDNAWEANWTAIAVALGDETDGTDPECFPATAFPPPPESPEPMETDASRTPPSSAQNLNRKFEPGRRTSKSAATASGTGGAPAPTAAGESVQSTFTFGAARTGMGGGDDGPAVPTSENDEKRPTSTQTQATISDTPLHPGRRIVTGRRSAKAATGAQATGHSGKTTTPSNGVGVGNSSANTNATKPDSVGKTSEKKCDFSRSFFFGGSPPQTESPPFPKQGGLSPSSSNGGGDVSSSPPTKGPMSGGAADPSHSEGRPVKSTLSPSLPADKKGSPLASPGRSKPTSPSKSSPLKGGLSPGRENAATNVENGGSDSTASSPSTKFDWSVKKGPIFSPQPSPSKLSPHPSPTKTKASPRSSPVKAKTSPSPHASSSKTKFTFGTTPTQPKFSPRKSPKANLSPSPSKSNPSPSKTSPSKTSPSKVGNSPSKTKSTDSDGVTSQLPTGNTSPRPQKESSSRSEPGSGEGRRTDTSAELPRFRFFSASSTSTGGEGEVTDDRGTDSDGAQSPNVTAPSSFTFSPGAHRVAQGRPGLAKGRKKQHTKRRPRPAATTKESFTKDAETASTNSNTTPARSTASASKTPEPEKSTTLSHNHHKHPLEHHCDFLSFCETYGLWDCQEPLCSVCGEECFGQFYNCYMCKFNVCGNESCVNPPSHTSHHTSHNAQSAPVSSPPSFEGRASASPVPKSRQSSDPLHPKAVESKEKANRLYTKGDYVGAVDLYTAAMSFASHWSVLYHNRAAARMALSAFKLALEDAMQAISLDESEPKYHVRAGKCSLRLGYLVQAELYFKSALSLSEADKTARDQLDLLTQYRKTMDDAARSIKAKRFTQALPKLKELYAQCPAAEIGVLHVQCLMGQRDVHWCKDLLRTLRQAWPLEPEVCCLSSFLALLEGKQTTECRKGFNDALKLDPEFEPAKQGLKLLTEVTNAKRAGNNAYKNGDHQKAIEFYTTAIELDPTNAMFLHSVLLTNRAVVKAKLGKTDDAITDCSRALEEDARYSKAQLKRAELFLAMEDFEEAISDYEAVKAAKPNDASVYRLIQTAKQALARHEKEQEKRDPYEILGVDRSADESAIKRAFKKKAMRMHPDRVSDPHLKRRSEKAFKQLNEAYRVLNDPAERRKLDRKKSASHVPRGYGSSSGYYFDDDDDECYEDEDYADAYGHYYETFFTHMNSPRCRYCGSPAARECPFGLCGSCCDEPSCHRHYGSR